MSPVRWMIAGAGTDVGKTIVAAILATRLQTDYWKPISCGGEDEERMQTLLEAGPQRVHPSAYAFKTGGSPHRAARLEGISIDCARLVPPHTSRPLVIEGVGG